MSTTNNLQVTLVEQSQAQKEVTINEALIRLDAVLNTAAIDKDLATPPTSPSEGDVYIIAASPTGAWSGKQNQVTYYNQTWCFIIPNEGMSIWVKDEDKQYVFDGTNWVANRFVQPLIVGGISYSSTPVTASAPASFSADRYLAITCNGSTYYMPLATATW